MVFFSVLSELRFLRPLYYDIEIENFNTARKK